MGIDGHERFHISGSRIDAADGARPWAEVSGTLGAAMDPPEEPGQSARLRRRAAIVAHLRAYQPARGDLTRAGVISSPVLSLAM